MTKSARLSVEAKAREAVALLYSCAPKCQRVAFPNGKPIHEFDVYAPNIVIGGVSTSPLKTSGGKSNTGGCDRASSELLWLSLWPGREKRIHVLTDKALAAWLVARYSGANFPHTISIYHYEVTTNTLSLVDNL